MEICALASGSSGNCFYVENQKNKKAILIDAGISSKQIIEGLSLINKNPKSIKGIFVSHEHSDHIKGIDVFTKNFKIPIFATKKVAKEQFLCSDSKLISKIKNNETIKLAGMEISAFPKSHSALDPIAFSISQGRKKVSVITDAGYACKNIIESVNGSDFLCIESNHDERMLENGDYPPELKKWIRSNEGHLSNTQASACVLEHASKNLKNVILCHISQNNNTPELALSTFNAMMKHRLDISPKISLSLRSRPSSIFEV